MAKFHILGVPISIFEVMPDPDDLAEEYRQIYDNNDEASIDRTLAIEAVMYKEYNLAYSEGDWIDIG